jgi:glyoxylase I family protein
MPVDHVLAVVPVNDLDVAGAWYERLLGRAPDNRPMETLIEWNVTGNGWIQVACDAQRAGSTLLNFAVSELGQYVAGLAAKGLEPGPVQTVNKNVQLCALSDPDGNIITLIGNFRLNY